MIEIWVQDPVRDADLSALAHRLHVEPRRMEPAHTGCALLRDAAGLLLRLRTERGRCDVRPARPRARAGLSRSTSLLARAVGGRRGETVVDATGGLGRDACELAALGYRVVVFERQPVLAFLLRDAFAGSVIEVHEEDARHALRALPPHSLHAVCLDPMFPERSKRAEVKKESQVLQHLIGRETDDADLLAAARQAGRRVVVKRPRRAPPLSDGVAFEVLGRAVRVDVYLAAGPSA